jgi:MoaA/NifB/PqqE/SkfB family radical SAM enzyme
MSFKRGIRALVTGKYRFGQLWNWYKTYHTPFGLKVKHDPPRLGIFLTTKCNMKCDFCLTHSTVIEDNEFKYQGSEDMSFDTFKDILDRFPNTLIVSFIGNGEPILNRNIYDMVKYARKKKMRSTLFSNGLVLERFIPKIIEAEIKTFNISLNAIDPEEYERFTGYSGTYFHKVVNNTRKLVEARNDTPNSDMNITATILVDKHNFMDMEKMIKFSEELGIDELILSHFMPWTTEGMTAEERSIYSDNKEAMNEINRLANNRYKVAVTFPTIFDGEKNNRLCRDNVLSMSIDGDGNVSGCERKMLNTERNGKYWEKDVFNNEHFQWLRKIFITAEEELPDPCVTCFNNTTCETKSIPKASQDDQNGPKEVDVDYKETA